MDNIDVELVCTARRLITGANIHLVNTLIFQYQQSVAIKNAGGRLNMDHPKFAFQHIGILSLEFHVDKLSRPLL